jgi:hypothetical protein
MQLDAEYLRQHYSSLTDEALLDIDRAELVELAQRIYDAEVRGRGLLAAGAGGRRPAPRPTPEPSDDLRSNDLSVSDEAYDREGEPSWLDEAAEVYSVVVGPGTLGSEIADARSVLEAAGIPCSVELVEMPEEKSPARKRWRLMVPGSLNLQATSTLDRDMFNNDFEAEWKTHLETFSDRELLAMSPEVVFCGLFDRVERVSKAYEEELARRGLNAE